MKSSDIKWTPKLVEVAKDLMNKYDMKELNIPQVEMEFRAITGKRVSFYYIKLHSEKQ